MTDVEFPIAKRYEFKGKRANEIYLIHYTETFYYEISLS